jgi:PAS domain S-box-containing protein
MSIVAGRAPFDVDGEAARLLESIQDVCFSLDPGWRFSYVNQAAEGFFRRSRADLLGRNLLELFPQLIGSTGHTRITQAFSDREHARFETVSVITGAPIELDIHPDAAGGVSVFLRDVSERKKGEQALAESEGRLKLAIEAADLGIWDWNTLTNEMTFSDKAKRIFGFASDAPVSSEQVRAATHPEDLPRTSEMARHALDPAIRSREPYDYRIVRPNGELRWVVARGGARFGLVDGEVTATRYTGTIQDITARKQADARLQQSEARLRLAVEAARLAVWGYDAASGRLENTPELNRLLGIPDGQALDLDEIRLRCLPGEEERVRAAGERALSEGDRYFQIEYRYLRPDDQTRWLLLRAEILMSADGKPSGARGVLLDITDQKTAEAHRELMVAELKHRVKNTLSLAAAMAGQTFRGDEHREALDTFLSRMISLGQAHDILFQENWQSADCREIVEKSLSPHRTGRGHFRISGPRLRLASRQALSLALALNELATNAAKYGALSADEGRVDIVWSIEPGDAVDAFRFRWIESNGPPVVAPARTGFGTRLVQKSLAAEFGGETTLEYPPTGLVCTLASPDPSRAV